LTVTNIANRDPLDIPRAYEARYDSGDSRNPCFEGTRADVLGEIRSWIDPNQSISHTAEGAECSPLPIPPPQQSTEAGIFWLTGLAGTGKSTIAQSIASWCYGRNWLGASFFFLRGDAARGNDKLLFSTIAHQLMTFHKPLEPLVKAAIKMDPDIFHSNLGNQLQKLIVDPLHALGNTFPTPAVVVIDALDECRDEGSTSTVLSILSNHIRDLQLKILVTSRPEIQIRRAFHSNDLQLRSSTRQYDLHDIKSNLVEADITEFLRDSFRRIEALYPELKGKEWVNDAAIKTIVLRSQGLFIFAATAIQFIGDKDFDNPEIQLLALLELGNRSSPPPQSSPYHRLDQLYTQVLHQAFPDSSSTSKLARFRTIVGAIISMYDQLSPGDLGSLLGIEASVIMTTLQHMRSVIVLPERSGVVRLLHISFVDFLTHPRRCSDPKLYIDPTIQHRFLAIRCFYHLSSLRRNICGLPDASRLNSELEDIQRAVGAFIPLPVQYACRFWAEHLSRAAFSESLVDFTNEFCTKYCLYWLEALSLMGRAGVAIPTLKLVQKTFAVSVVVIRSLHISADLLTEPDCTQSSCVFAEHPSGSGKIYAYVLYSYQFGRPTHILFRLTFHTDGCPNAPTIW
jgi:hypothetical protein